MIGLCAAVERARWSVWDDEAVLLPRSYAIAVTRAGGLPVLLPPENEVDASEWIDLVDGLILAGGADYGEVPDRDAFEVALGLEALDRDVPLLGVCRGMQILNIAAGGTLDQHLPDSLRAEQQNGEERELERLEPRLRRHGRLLADRQRRDQFRTRGAEGQHWRLDINTSTRSGRMSTRPERG